jgi:uncharacterized membrane protein
MVTREISPTGTRIILSPNRSATWHQAKLYCLILAFPCALIALSWYFVGAWLILPFAGLEIGMMVLVTYQTNRNTLIKQILDIEAHNIQVTEGRKRPSNYHKLLRPAVHLNVYQPEQPLALAELTLTDGNTSLKLGDFLNKSDRSVLQKYLTESGVMVCRNRWWTK